MIETKLTTLAVYEGVVPDRSIQDDNTRALAVWSFLKYTSNTLATNINESFVPKINKIKDEVNNTAEDINTKHQEVVEASQITVAAKEKVLGVVSILPEGTVNDKTISAADTYSSQEIESKLSQKQNLAQATATALYF